MDKLCLLVGWGVARSTLFLLEDQDDGLLFQFFVAINSLGFFAHAVDTAISYWTVEQQVKVPDEVLYGISCAGGSAGASLAMVLFQNKRSHWHFQISHAALCASQGLVLMALIQYKYGYPMDDQISASIDELQYAVDMVWHNLLSRFSQNCLKHQSPGRSTQRFFRNFYGYFQ